MIAVGVELFKKLENKEITVEQAIAGTSDAPPGSVQEAAALVRLARAYAAFMRGRYPTGGKAHQIALLFRGAVFAHFSALQRGGGAVGAWSHQALVWGLYGAELPPEARYASQAASLRNTIATLIAETGGWPSDRRLAKAMGVSRPTAKKARERAEQGDAAFRASAEALGALLS